MKRGMSQGIERAKHQMVRNMLQKGLEIDVIAEISELSLSEIEEMRDTL